MSTIHLCVVVDYTLNYSQEERRRNEVNGYVFFIIQLIRQHGFLKSFVFVVFISCSILNVFGLL